MLTKTIYSSKCPLCDMDMKYIENQELEKKGWATFLCENLDCDQDVFYVPIDSNFIKKQNIQLTEKDMLINNIIKKIRPIIENYNIYDDVEEMTDTIKDFLYKNEDFYNCVKHYNYQIEYEVVNSFRKQLDFKFEENKTTFIFMFVKRINEGEIVKQCLKYKLVEF